MFLVVAAFSLLLLIGSFVIPESPRWLMLKGKKELAIKNLKKVLCTDDEVDFEIQEIEKTLANKEETGINVTFKGYFLKVLIIGVLLQMFQQLVGINVMIYYAPTIFGYAGITGLTAMLTVPIVNMLFTFPAIYLVEKWGRKKLLHVGAGFMLVTMITAGLAFQAIDSVVDPALITNTPKIVLLLAVVLYIFGFAVSWGPVVWIVCSEIFPLKGREVGMTITTMVNWTFAGILMRYALSFMEYFGKSLLFYLFAAFCVLAIVFVALFVPETKGVTLENLENRLKN
jgi:SP family galactose:H+ symporter-like MFS transporter